jgi:hypothetical protein
MVLNWQSEDKLTTHRQTVILFGFPLMGRGKEKTFAAAGWSLIG